MIEIADAGFGAPEVRVAEALQTDFSLHQTLSLWLLEAQDALDRELPDYALTLLSLVEAVQEDPVPILREQAWQARRAQLSELAAEGVDYDERMRRTEDVTHPQPEREFIAQSFALFAEKHPWVRSEDVHPKSVAREMLEGFVSFREYVSHYNLARCEGLLLRYLAQVHNTLVKSVPDAAKSDEVYDVIAFLRTTVARVDSSLIEAWESLVRPAQDAGDAPERAVVFDLAKNERALRARVRQELLACVAALARGEYEEAAGYLHRSGRGLGRGAPGSRAGAGRVRAHPAHPRSAPRALDLAAPDRHAQLGRRAGAARSPRRPLHGEVDLRAERDPEQAGDAAEDRDLVG